MTDANYKIKAIPTDGKTWEKADKVEVSLTLDLPDERRTFKGVLPMFGIQIKGGV